MRGHKLARQRSDWNVTARMSGVNAVDVDRADQCILDARPALTEPRQRLHVDRGAVVLHGGRRGHVAPAQERPRHFDFSHRSVGEAIFRGAHKCCTCSRPIILLPPALEHRRLLSYCRRGRVRSEQFCSDLAPSTRLVCSSIHPHPRARSVFPFNDAVGRLRAQVGFL